jgi:heme-degrading monooxygenase HmoA
MYYAVVFTSIKRETADEHGYQQIAHQMEELAKLQPGFLGVESARNELGITVSYWESLEAIKNWKNNAEHKLAQHLGYEKFYSYYKTRICKVEREYEFGNIET